MLTNNPSIPTSNKENARDDDLINSDYKNTETKLLTTDISFAILLISIGLNIFGGVQVTMDTVKLGNSQDWGSWKREQDC